MPARREQQGGFDYDYRMKCDCGGSSYLSAVDYEAELNSARMPCEHCDRRIHFGPAVMALRNPDDPMLDNIQVSQVAWYHTSTTPEWPSVTFAEDQRATLRQATRHIRPEQRAKYVERQLNQALHVGTYEAAIENMLRRISDQNDAGSQFYLHRVTLEVPPSMINDGYRDENHEAAARVSSSDLRDAGLAAVRYLNVHESPGSVSLAVVPESITCVQTTELPIFALATAHSDSLFILLQNVQVSLDELARQKPDTSGLTPPQLRRMILARSRGGDPDGIGAAHVAYQKRSGELWGSVVSELVEDNLGGVSPVVQERFRSAIGHSRGASSALGVRQFADFFAASAVAVNRPDAVKKLLASAKARTSSLRPDDLGRLSQRQSHHGSTG